MNQHKYAYVLFLVFFLSFVVSGCVNSSPGGGFIKRDIVEKPPLANQSLLSFFCDFTEQPRQQLNIQISDMEIHTGEQWISVLPSVTSISSEHISTGQILLTRASLPAGTYTKLRFTYEETAAQKEENGQMKGNKITKEILFTAPLQLLAQESQCLFLDWKLSPSQSKQQQFEPLITVFPQEISLSVDLAFVTCPDIDTIYIIRTDTNKVIGAWGIPGKPSDFVLNYSTDVLYVLSQKNKSIVIVEISSGRVVDSFFIPMGTDPSFMEVSPDFQYAYVLDQRNFRLIKIQLSDGSLAGTFNFDYPVEYLSLLEGDHRLAVSSSSVNEVYLLDKETLQKVQTIQVGRKISSMVLVNNQLLIAEKGATTLLAYNIHTSVEKRPVVGLGPERFLQVNNRLYVSASKAGRIDVLDPDELYPIKTIRIGGAPVEMAASTNRRWLYVADVQRGGLAVLDLSSYRLEKRIDLAAVPHSIAVTQ